MQLTSPAELAAFAQGCQDQSTTAVAPSRLISIWEITQWILPMAPEHLRRVLAAEPHLPQGMTGTEGGTRWFTPADVATLRLHFATGRRQRRYLTNRPAGCQAAVVALAGPQGASGRSSSLIHLATAAALAGLRVLMIDADPAGRLAAAYGLPAEGAGVMALLGQTAAVQLRRLNEARLDRGEAPLAMAESLARALATPLPDLIRPTVWPGLDLLAAGPDLMQADLQILSWRAGLRGWQPWQALAAGLQTEGLRDRYDLILIDTGRGLGPLALAALNAAEILLAPIPLHTDPQHMAALNALGLGLTALGQAVADQQAEAAMTARALGQLLPEATLPWQRLLVLPVRATAATAAQAGGFAAKLGAALLPNPLPELAVLATGQMRNFYDLDYRDLGRQDYGPLRQACQDGWTGFASVLQQHWAAQGKLV